MILEDEARKLLTLKQQKDNLDTEYDNQRSAVHNVMLNEQKKYYELDGFRITREEDAVRLVFSRELLKDELIMLGLNDNQLTRIFARSKEEQPKTGILRITRIQD